MRAQPDAAWLGLALPRFLLRLPYGKKTDRCERFDFEELPDDPLHEHYLWGSPALACAVLLGVSFGRDGWNMGDALEQYRKDASPDSPNQVPREFWPSTCRFRGILYRAGKRLGRDGAVYLDRIPDDDLRLFAQIEFAAALAGLPELQGTQREYHPGINMPAG